MNKGERYIELAVGVFILLGICCIAYISFRLAGRGILVSEGYEVHAIFTNISGLNSGAAVEIAGVEVGRVKDIFLDDYDAHVLLSIDSAVKIQSDVIASIKTKGLFGEKFIEIYPGGEDEPIPPDGTIINTEPAIDFESLISKFVHGDL